MSTMSKEYYDRTYGMSFYTFLTLCGPRKDGWYKDAIQHLEDVKWYKFTPAREIVGEAEVARLVEQLNLV